MYSISPCAPWLNQFPNSSVWAGGEHDATRHESNPISRAKSTSRAFDAAGVVGFIAVGRSVPRFISEPTPPTDSKLFRQLHREFSWKYRRVRPLPRRKAVRASQIIRKRPRADFLFAAAVARSVVKRARTVSFHRPLAKPSSQAS